MKKMPWPAYLPIPKTEEELFECIGKMELKDLLEFEKYTTEAKNNKLAFDVGDRTA